MDTFLVTNYNQENEILYTLESIKYQVQKYAGNRITELIIADNCSNDKSVVLIKQWLEKNERLFNRVETVFRSENIGLCKNYADLLRRANGERFVLVYGDDLLAPFSVFDVLDELDKFDIVCTGAIKFHGDGIMVRNKRAYLNVVLQGILGEKSIRYGVKMGCPILNGAVFRKKLLTEEVLEYVCEYTYVNDRPCFQKIFEENPKLSIDYINRPLILYRIAENSISNIHSPVRKNVAEELARQYDTQLNKKQNILVRISLKWQRKMVLMRGRNALCNILRYFTPYYLFLFINILKNYNKVSKREKELVDIYAGQCEEFFTMIKQRVNEYYM